MRKPLLIIAVIHLTIAAASSAMAQTQEDQMRTTYLQARNQLGILQYCIQNGGSKQNHVELQRKIIKLIPTPADVSGGDEVEGSGRKGIIYVSANQSENIEKVAEENGGSIPAFCKIITDSLEEVRSLVE